MLIITAFIAAAVCCVLHNKQDTLNLLLCILLQTEIHKLVQTISSGLWLLFVKKQLLVYFCFLGLMNTTLCTLPPSFGFSTLPSFNQISVLFFKLSVSLRVKINTSYLIYLLQSTMHTSGGFYQD